MFKQIFATMNDVLDEIIRQYAALPSPAQKENLAEQLNVLKQMSDICMEQWLLFEEKLGGLHPNLKQPHESKVTSAAATEAISFPCSESYGLSDYGLPDFSLSNFIKGQGFYKLYMFEQAVPQFEMVVQQHPDFILARIYLAMSYLRLGAFVDAYCHFQFILPLTDDLKIKAISYNAMGCIQAENKNINQAFEYFKLAYQADPSCVEPTVHLGIGMRPL